MKPTTVSPKLGRQSSVHTRLGVLLAALFVLSVLAPAIQAQNQTRNPDAAPFLPTTPGCRARWVVIGTPQNDASQVRMCLRDDEVNASSSGAAHVVWIKNVPPSKVCTILEWYQTRGEDWVAAPCSNHTVAPTPLATKSACRLMPITGEPHWDLCNSALSDSEARATCEAVAVDITTPEIPTMNLCGGGGAPCQSRQSVLNVSGQRMFTCQPPPPGLFRRHRLRRAAFHRPHLPAASPLRLRRAAFRPRLHLEAFLRPRRLVGSRLRLPRAVSRRLLGSGVSIQFLRRSRAKVASGKVVPPVLRGRKPSPATLALRQQMARDARSRGPQAREAYVELLRAAGHQRSMASSKMIVHREGQRAFGAAWAHGKGKAHVAHKTRGAHG